MRRYPPATLAIGETIITSFKTYTDELRTLTISNSTLLSSRSITTLEAISLLHKLGLSPSNVIYQFNKALPSVSTAFRDIVSNLSENIGKLVEPVNEVITLTENAIMKTLVQFRNRFVERGQGRCVYIDFESAVKSARLFANTVALIAETALSKCGNVTFANETYEAISILMFILNLYLTGLQGGNCAIATVLLLESKSISPFLKSSFQALDPMLGGIARAMAAITTDTAKSMRELLTKFVDLTLSFDDALNEILGPCSGAKITVEHIRKNLAKSQGKSR